MERQANEMLDVCFQTRLCLFFASSRLKIIPVPRDKPHSVHIKWLQKTFPGPFSISMEWCYYISSLPLISSLMKAGCLSLYHSVSPNPFSFWKSSVFHYPLCVSLYLIFFLFLFLFPDFCVYFSWSAGKPSSLFLSIALFSLLIRYFLLWLRRFLSTASYVLSLSQLLLHLCSITFFCSPTSL